MSTPPAPVRPAPSKRRPRAPRLWRRLGQVALALLALALLGAFFETRSERADARRFPPAGRLLDAGGHRLHLRCQGQGRPVVVIEAGWGDWSLSWRRVQALASRTTTTCAYDRAGMGHSDAGPLPRDASHFADELHLLLRRSGLPGPYVLVGHSLGGLAVRVYTGRYRQDVRGVVLIDAMAPGLTKPRVDEGAPTNARVAGLLAAPSRLGLVRLLAGPLGLQAGLPPQLQAESVALSVTPRHARTSALEGLGMPASLQQAARVTTFGDLPLVVLSRGLDLEPAWQVQQAALLGLSSRSEHLIAQRSGHTIELDEPEAAAGAIARLLSRLR